MDPQKLIKTSEFYFICNKCDMQKTVGGGYPLGSLKVKTYLGSTMVILPLSRGVQYSHCVMHRSKCIMVKLRGKQKTRKVCKKHETFTKSGGKLQKVWGKIIIFPK